MCGSCKRKIWMKTAFQCQNCLACVHKKCVNKFNQQAACIHSPQMPIIDDDIPIDETLLRDDNTKKSVRASRIANAASSAYSTLRRLKPKQSTMKPENRRSPDVDISETDLQDIITVMFFPYILPRSKFSFMHRNVYPKMILIVNHLKNYFEQKLSIIL